MLRFRLKDRHATWLNGLARKVNFVWNEGQEYALRVLEGERPVARLQGGAF